MAHHGNWCGPGWTAGKWMDAVDMDEDDFKVPAVSELDQLCKDHDIDLYNAKSPEETETANTIFVNRAKKHGIIGKGMAALVDNFGPFDYKQYKRKHDDAYQGEDYERRKRFFQRVQQQRHYGIRHVPGRSKCLA